MKKRTVKRKSNKILLINSFLIAMIFIVLPVIPSFADFEPKTEVFSVDKNPPPGFSQLVEPNVLLLIDTSGSMTFPMDSNNSTYGDGTKPCDLGGVRLNYGKDENPGENKTGNNDPDNDFNYHPNLRYIPSDEIAETDSSYISYFSYEKKIGKEWVEASWNVVDKNGTKPSLPAGHSWKWKGNRWYIYKGNNRLQKRDPQPSLPSLYRYVITGGNKSSTTVGLEKLTEGYWKPDSFLGYKYKYPNDSRMYVLKNVLYRILDDQNLVGGLRLGLSAYSQTHKPSGQAADWYKWPPVSNGTGQRITWKSSGAKAAVLHVDFKSTTNVDDDEGDLHRESIQEWFDGTDDSDNKEFRADGATPLVASIVNKTAAKDCALDFFKTQADSKFWCRDNWLIVLTDGDDSSETYANTALAAQTLYNSDLGFANARPVKTMVIGMIDPKKQTDLAAALKKMAVYGRGGDVNTPGDFVKYPAYFPQDMQELMDAFRTIFQTIQDVSGSGSAPLVNPPKTPLGGGLVYSAGFKPKIDQQWLGYLSSYTISNGIVSSSPQWEASEKLNKISYSARNIYTADWDGGTAGKLAGTNLKSFAPGEASALRPFMAASLGSDAVNDTELGQFINWVRGHHDDWNKSSGDDRWKLGDPYHVGLVEVGSPQSLLTDSLYRQFAADNANKTRKKIVYVHANDGMVHAINATDDETDKGKEEWAFIPPNVLNFPRLIGTKLHDDNRIMRDENSRPKYLLDGPLLGEDILLYGAYKTVLLGGLGKAGCGLYALDVTVPEKPQFLWALENNIYGFGGVQNALDNQTFLSWKGGNGTASSALTKVSSTLETVPGRLRLTVSTPFVGTVDLKKETTIETKWIALLGAGVQYDPLIEQDDGGKAVIALDMTDGSLIKEITHEELGMAVAPLSIEAGPRPMRIGKFYLGDSKGSIFEGDLSAYEKAEWEIDQVFTPGDTVASDDFFGIPFSVEIGSIKKSKWLFWGTGDPDSLFGGQEGRNHIFAMNRSLAGSSGFTFSDLPELVYDAGAGDTIAQSPNGWRQKLDENEIVTTLSLLYKGYLFLATYVPVADDPCEVGNSYIYIIKADTGHGGFITTDADGQITSRKKRIELKATRISGITVAADKVYIGITQFSKATNPKDALDTFTGNVELNANLLSFDIPDHIKLSSGTSSSTKMEPAYWRDWRP